MDYVERIAEKLRGAAGKKLYDELYRELLLAIIQSDMPAGTRIITANMVKELGVSPTPFRTALSKLQDEGFIQMIPNKGARVVGYSSREAADIYYYRSVLEQLAATQACQRMEEQDHVHLLSLADRIAYEVDVCKEQNTVTSPEVAEADLAFHRCIVACSKNPYLIKEHTRMMPKFRYVRYFIKNLQARTPFSDGHYMLCAALRDGNPELVTALVDHHLNYFTAPIAPKEP